MKKLYFILLIVLYSCVEQPGKPEYNPNPTDLNTVVLCEGLLGMDNSSISALTVDNSIHNNYFANSNSGLKLGDTANDILIKNDTAFVTLTGSGAIEIFQLSTGKSIKRIVKSEFYPRDLAMDKAGNIYISDLYTHKVFKLDAATLEISEYISSDLQNPEGIAVYDNYLYVLNSGLGIFHFDEEFSGSVSIFDIATASKIKDVYIGANLQEIVIDKQNQRFYFSYYNTYEKDSVGGIVIFEDALLQNRVKHLKMNNTSLCLSNNNLYCIAQTPPGSDEEFNSYICEIDPTADFSRKELFANPNSQEFFTALNIDNNNDIWLGNAKNLQINGSIEVYDNSGNLLRSFNTGVNPAKIVFLSVN